jgi:CheY-like chemotaxis protein
MVFMDHMMPGMDGLEATARIRALDKEKIKDLPIVALTANAVSGMKEMFIEKGFNGFLAKPIDVAKLDEALETWIPKEKQVR